MGETMDQIGRAVRIDRRGGPGLDIVAVDLIHRLAHLLPQDLHVLGLHSLRLRRAALLARPLGDRLFADDPLAAARAALVADRGDVGDVEPGTAEEAIVAGAAVQGVVAGPAVDEVVATPKPPRRSSAVAGPIAPSITATATATALRLIGVPPRDSWRPPAAPARAREARRGRRRARGAPGARRRSGSVVHAAS